MADPVRVGPWVQVKQGVAARHYANSERNPAMASYDDFGWTIWADSAQDARVMVHGDHTGDEGKRRADAVADALGWVLERDPETEPREVPRIVMDPARMTGEPTIGESRLTVRTVLWLIAQGCEDAQILDHYDYLTQEGIDAARAWWASPEGMAWALGKIAALEDMEEE